MGAAAVSRMDSLGRLDQSRDQQKSSCTCHIPEATTWVLDSLGKAGTDPIFFKKFT